MTTSARAMTAHELEQLPDDGFHRYELVRGQLLVREPAGFYHGRVASTVAFLLEQAVRQGRLGVVVTADPGFHIEQGPDTVRAPDVAFVRAERLAPLDQLRGFYVGAPDLAVEVLSPSTARTDLREKVPQWIAAGTRAVWVVDLDARIVTVYCPAMPPLVLRDGEQLDGGDVVPGFAHDVAELFA